MPFPSWVSNSFRKAGEIWNQADRATGGWLPGGTASPLSETRQNIQNAVNETGSSMSGQVMNTLPDRVNLFTRYITGVGNKNLQLDPSTLTDLRTATEKKSKEILIPVNKNNNEFLVKTYSGPSFPQSGPTYPYDSRTPKSVTNTLGRFNATVDPKLNTIRMQDTYDMSNRSEDPDLISGKIQPDKAWNEIESIWNPGSSNKNSPLKRGFNLPDQDYSLDNIKKGLAQSGQSPTYSPATRFARALMYVLPIKPEPYNIDIIVPLIGEIK